MLKGKTALITGAGKGIGRQIALTMAGQGADLVLADVNPAALEETWGLAEEAGARAVSVTLDITDHRLVAEKVGELFQELGGIHILVNNAAIFEEAAFVEMTESQWQRNLDVNLTGLFNVTRAFAPPACGAGGGCIISIASVDAFQGCRSFSHYAMAKAGVVGLTRTLAQELGPRGVRVNAIAPGITLTDMTRERIAENEAAYLERIPLGRVGQPADIANAALFLASDLAGYITGQVIHVNGGMYFG